MSRISLVLVLLFVVAGCVDATCEEACDNLYACMPDTSAPKSECVSKCGEDEGKGTPENRNCIAEASCDSLEEGKCPDLIVR